MTNDDRSRRVTDNKCDSCAVQARITVMLLNGGVLQFCLHHWRENRNAPAMQSARVEVDGILVD
jgi:hypothetical protein